MVNFRKNLIQKCLLTDGTVADEDTLSDVLRNSPEADNSKLVAYAWQHVIPAAERPTVYKQLLGISGAYPETREVIAKHRADDAWALLNGLRGLNRFSGTIVEDQPIPTSWDLAKMLLISLNLFSKNVVEEPPHVAKLGNHANLRDIEDQERVLGIIVKQVHSLCPENWIDVFHISRGIVKLIDKEFPRQGSVDQFANEIRNSLVNIHGISKAPSVGEFRVYVRSCMTPLVTCNRAMFLIFDKVVTGHPMKTLLRSFAISLFIALEKNETDFADQQRCATQAIEETWKAMKSGGTDGGSSRPSWPRETPRPVMGRQSYSLGEAR